MMFFRKVTTTHIIMGLLLLSTFLNAGMFTFHLGVWDLQRAQVNKIEQQAADLEDIQRALLNITKSTLNNSQNNKDLLEYNRQLNLAGIQQNDLIFNITKQISDENNERSGEHAELGGNMTQLLRGHEQLIRGLLNGSAQ